MSILNTHKIADRRNIKYPEIGGEYYRLSLVCILVHRYGVEENPLESSLNNLSYLNCYLISILQLPCLKFILFFII